MMISSETLTPSQESSRSHFIRVAEKVIIRPSISLLLTSFNLTTTSSTGYSPNTERDESYQYFNTTNTELTAEEHHSFRHHKRRFHPRNHSGILYESSSTRDFFFQKYVKSREKDITKNPVVRTGTNF